MILDPITYIKHKLTSMIVSFGVAGAIFIILGVTIIFLPQVVQYLFVIGFVIFGMLMLLIALRITHLRDVVGSFDILAKVKK